MAKIYKSKSIDNIFMQKYKNSVDFVATENKNYSIVSLNLAQLKELRKLVNQAIVDLTFNNDE